MKVRAVCVGVAEIPLMGGILLVYAALAHDRWVGDAFYRGCVLGVVQLCGRGISHWRARKKTKAVANEPTSEAAALSGYIRTGQLPRSPADQQKLAIEVRQRHDRSTPMRQWVSVVLATALAVLGFALIAGGGPRLAAAAIVAVACLWIMVAELVSRYRLARIQRQLPVVSRDRAQPPPTPAGRLSD